MTKRLICTGLLMLVMFCTQKRQAQSGIETGIPWIAQIDSALDLANAQNKPLMIDFKAEWCPPCRMMEDSTFHDPAVVEKAALFVPVRIDVDEQGDVADHYNANAGKYGGVGIPNILFLDGQENRIAHYIGFQSAGRLSAVMDSVLDAVQPGS
ncbi:thioredoxin family protein [bacterium]|nr:thioredoxin family protein [bacterium]